MHLERIDVPGDDRLQSAAYGGRQQWDGMDGKRKNSVHHPCGMTNGVYL